MGFKLENKFRKLCENYETEIEQLKAGLRMSDLNRQSLWVDSLKLVDENAALKSKLKIAITCINDIFNKSKDQSHIEQLSRQALKEIGGEI